MHFEVEQKYRTDAIDAVRQRLCVLGAQAGELLSQNDVYYAHPQRDFAATDEAMRLRRAGQCNCFTYKGPKIDAETKTRREVELKIAAGDAGAQQGDELLLALGFRRVAEVCKQRQCYHVARGRWTIEVSLDEVEGLGPFVELEIVASEAEVDSAQQAIARLADELGLSRVERSSYLELLLE